MAEINVNLDELPDSEGFEPLPAGQYLLEVTSSDVTDPPAAQGIRVSIEYRVMTGPYEGRKGWDRFDTQRWAKTKNGDRQIDGSRFKLLCAAVGVQGHISDTTQLHGIPFLASATIEPANGQYGPKNRWGNYKPNGGTQTQAPARSASPAQQQRPAATQAAPAQKAGGSRPGWMKSAGIGARQPAMAGAGRQHLDDDIPF